MFFVCLNTGTMILMKFSRLLSTLLSLKSQGVCVYVCVTHLLCVCAVCNTSFMCVCDMI